MRNNKINNREKKMGKIKLNKRSILSVQNGLEKIKI